MLNESLAANRSSSRELISQMENERQDRETQLRGFSLPKANMALINLEDLDAFFSP